LLFEVQGGAARLGGCLGAELVGLLAGVPGLADFVSQGGVEDRGDLDFANLGGAGVQLQGLILHPPHSRSSLR
jgi:hypothetical protein